MIGLSDNQLEVIMLTAEPLPEEKCHEFLERVAAVLQVRGQINDDDVAAAVQLALGALIHNSAAWKNWNRNWLPTRQDGQGFGAPLAGPPAALTTWRAWRLLPAWSTKLRKWATQVFAASPPWDESNYYF
jgi:hypothetical protein